MLRVTMVLCAALALSGAVHADEVQFRNGDRLSGKIDRLDGDKLIVTSSVAGEVKANLADIKTFSTDGPIEIRLKDGTVIKQKVAAGPDGKINLDKGALQPQAIALSDVTAINPPKVKWTGDITAGGILTRGDSDAESLNIGIALVRRGEDDRISLNAAYLYSRQRDTNTGERNTTTDNWFAAAKYDYFFTPKFYGYGQARVERDRIAELDLRLIAGLGAGYQWVERPDFNFNTEAGLAWFYEKYSNVDESNDAISLRLAYHVDKRLNDQVTFFHNLQYFPSIEDLGDYFITTDAGVRASLTKRMFTEFKVALDYDSTPAPGAKHTNVRYILSLGWAF